MSYNTTIELFGLIAGAITSMGFIPQLIRGYRTKKLDDVSYYMPIVLAIGMTLWFIYGLLQQALAVIIANSVGIGSCLILLIMKAKYS
jgi:MtN3 and saliva related transmembrane protein